MKLDSLSTRDRLKVLAMDVVQDRGIRALTLRDLGKAAGIKSSSVAYHFGSKEALLQEITEDYVSKLVAAMKQIDRDLPPGRERILTLFDQFVGLSKAERLCLGGVMAGSLHEVGEETGEIVRNFFRDIEAWIALQIRRSSNDEIGRAEASQRARALVAGAQGALILDKTDGKSTHIRAVKKSVEALVEP